MRAEDILSVVGVQKRNKVEADMDHTGFSEIRREHFHLAANQANFLLSHHRSAETSFFILFAGGVVEFIFGLLNFPRFCVLHAAQDTLPHCRVNLNESVFSN